MGKRPRIKEDRKERPNRHADLSVPGLLWSEAVLYERVTEARAPLILVLDGIQDPHNLGACMRSADAAGVLAVVAPKDRSVPLTSAARRVACGAAENTPFVQVTNLARCLRRLKELDLWLVGASERADQTLHEADLKGPLGIVVGAEGTGLRRLTRAHCDLLVKIPMAPTRKVDCLNVSVAAGVVLFEALRQRSGGGS